MRYFLSSFLGNISLLLTRPEKVCSTSQQHMSIPVAPQGLKIKLNIGLHFILRHCDTTFCCFQLSPPPPANQKRLRLVAIMLTSWSCFPGLCSQWYFLKVRVSCGTLNYYFAMCKTSKLMFVLRWYYHWCNVYAVHNVCWVHLKDVAYFHYIRCFCSLWIYYRCANTMIRSRWWDQCSICLRRFSFCIDVTNEKFISHHIQEESLVLHSHFSDEYQYLEIFHLECK